MAKIVVSDGQSLLDVALWLLGDTAAVFDLADANDLAVTDDLVAGQVLEVPVSLLGRSDIVSYFATRSYRVNTGNQSLTQTSVPPEQPAGASFFHPDYFNSENYG